MILSSFYIILTKQQTLSVTRLFDSSLVLYYKWSIVTLRLSCTVMEIWRLKDNGVTSLTFWGHVTSSVTKERWKKRMRKRKRERKRRKEKVKVEGEKEGKGKGEKERKIKGRGREMEMEKGCLLYTSPSPRDRQKSRMPSSA